MKLKDAIATRIKELCKQHKLSIHGLSLQAGIANSTLADMKNARNESVQIKYIYSICSGLNMDIKEFFDRPYFDKNTLID